MFRKYNLNCGQIEKLCWLNATELSVGDTVTLPPVGRYERAYPTWTVKQRFSETTEDAQWRSYVLTGVVSQTPKPVERLTKKPKSKGSLTEQSLRDGLEGLFQ